MRLQYELAVTGENTIRNVIRGVERELQASNRRMAARARQPGGAAHAMTGGDDVSRQQKQQIDYWHKAALASGRQRHTEEMRNIKTQEREKARALRQSASAATALDRQRSQALTQQFRAEESARRRAQRDMSQGAARSVRGAFGGVGRIGAMALGLAGGFGAAEALSTTMDARRRASNLANMAGTPGLKGQLYQEAGNVRGFDRSEALAGMEGFVEKTGDVNAARGALPELGQLALATGTDLADMGQAAGQAFNVIRDQVKDPVKQLEMLQDVMRTVAAQGNMGAVEIKDMAVELATLGAATRRFEGGPGELLKTVGAMAQASVARGGAASAAEASTSVTRFAQDMIEHQGKFRAAGVEVFADKKHTQLKGPEKAMLDILENTGGDMGKIGSKFGVYAQRAVYGFSPLYTDAEAKAEAEAKRTGKKFNKGAAGRAAVAAEFARYQGATLSKETVAERAASRFEDPDIQIKEAAKHFNDAVGKELAPVAGRLADEFVKLAPLAGGIARVFADFVGFFAAHPALGVGTLIGGAIVKDIISAGVGSAVSSALAAVIKKIPIGTGGAAAAPGTPGGSNVAGAIGAGATIGLAVATAIITSGVTNFQTGEQNLATGGQRVLAAEASQDPVAIRAILDQQRKALNDRKAPGIIESVFGKGAGNFVDNTLAVDSNKGVEIKTQEGYIARIEAALEKATKAQVDAANKIASAAPAAARTSPIVDPARGG